MGRNDDSRDNARDAIKEQTKHLIHPV